MILMMSMNETDIDSTQSHLTEQIYFVLIENYDAVRYKKDYNSSILEYASTMLKSKSDSDSDSVPDARSTTDVTNVTSDTGVVDSSDSMNTTNAAETAETAEAVKPANTWPVRSDRPYTRSDIRPYTRPYTRPYAKPRPKSKTKPSRPDRPCVKQVEQTNQTNQTKTAVPDTRFEIGMHKCLNNKNCAGILPLLYHNNNLYAMLGLDSKFMAYSDFGGGFDIKYAPDTHKDGDSYKNTVLQKYQIAGGVVNASIMTDHVTNMNTNTDPTDLGYGDINTAYTAFREFIEETTSYIRKNNTDTNSEHTNTHTHTHTHANTQTGIRYLVDLDNLFRKIFVSKQYIYLGGDPQYNYDTFVLCFTIDDIDSVFRPNILKQIELIEQDRRAYMSSVSRKYDRSECNVYRNSETGFELTGNSEMVRIDMFPLTEILKQMAGVRYADYTYQIKEQTRNEVRKKIREHTNYHGYYYGAAFYDCLRFSFADAMVRYNRVFQNLITQFESVKSSLI